LASTILSILYDHLALVLTSDPLIEIIHDFAQDMLAATSVKSILIDFFPWAMNFPSLTAGWKKRAEEGRIKYSRIFLDLFCEVEE
jgi:hypothetical protein